MVVEENEELRVGQLSPKVDSILDRRKQLKRQRRNRFLQAFWRTSATLTFTLSLGWSLSQPEWKIRSLDQVSILGNTQLSTQTLEQLLPLTYPASLIRVQPQAIAQQLQRYAHVEQVVVSRQLFPPQVTIVIQERPPVAKVRCSSCTLLHGDQAPFAQSDLWLIDSAGVVLPLKSYPEIERNQSLPKLEIKGYFKSPKDSKSKNSGNRIVIDPEKQAHLQKILPLLLGSPVPIQSLDWRNPSNLKLMTPLGPVHLSQPSEASKIKAQLEALDRLRSLPQQIDISQVAYIDLADPESPTLTLKKQPNQPQVIQSE